MILEQLSWKSKEMSSCLRNNLIRFMHRLNSTVYGFMSFMCMHKYKNYMKGSTKSSLVKGLSKNSSKTTEEKKESFEIVLSTKGTIFTL